MATISYSKTSKAVGEFQNTNLWLVQFHIPTTEYPEAVKFRCQSTQLPTQEVETLQAEINRFRLTQQGSVKRDGEIEFRFIESTDAQTTRFLDTLTQQFWSMTENDAQGFSQGWKALKGSVIATLLDGRGNPTQEYKLIDCGYKPEFAGGIELGSENQVMSLTLKVFYNYWFYRKL